jgi:hypothetical protein
MNKHIDAIKAHALAVHTAHREEFEDSFDDLALPGREVITVREPFRPGRRGVVTALSFDGPEIWLRVMFADGELRIPASAVARREGAPDCATAHLRHKVNFVRFTSGEFLG